ncbi:outer membrane protein assembly factor BamE [Parahaliea maris]|uniref:Outer membrane protein assembly factor BamE n=1 Tax=Parahaliea maris TaxID=2716870 RepID=A0A5C8ZRX9_9GAMM|nr:outer membrane protein assembly factor BamE [Parahaliea maris]TXS91263.1 outer membrane protein assembly factor BamE [Parahaliea maris]
MRSILLLLIAFSLSGCGALGFPGVYRIDVEQGNLVEQDMVDQLQPGMSRRQVRFILGTPLVEDPFNPTRWDYPYVIRNGTKVIREAQMSVYFDGDRLVDVTGDYQPDWASGAASDQESSDENDSDA